MATIGVKELRDNLGVVLRKVEKGEVITVLRHGKGIAELRPLRTSKAETALLQLKKNGLMNGGSGVVGFTRSVKNRKPDTLISDIVVEDRR